jgi:hypothetical protein
MDRPGVNGIAWSLERIDPFDPLDSFDPSIFLVFVQRDHADAIFSKTDPSDIACDSAAI